MRVGANLNEIAIFPGKLARAGDGYCLPLIKLRQFVPRVLTYLRIRYLSYLLSVPPGRINIFVSSVPNTRRSSLVSRQSAYNT